MDIFLSDYSKVHEGLFLLLQSVKSVKRTSVVALVELELQNFVVCTIIWDTLLSCRHSICLIVCPQPAKNGKTLYGLHRSNYWPNFDQNSQE